MTRPSTLWKKWQSKALGVGEVPKWLWNSAGSVTRGYTKTEKMDFRQGLLASSTVERRPAYVINCSVRYDLRPEPDWDAAKENISLIKVRIFLHCQLEELFFLLYHFKKLKTKQERKSIQSWSTGIDLHRVFSLHFEVVSIQVVTPALCHCSSILYKS